MPAVQGSTSEELISAADFLPPPAVPDVSVRPAWWRRRGVRIAALVVLAWVGPPLVDLVGGDALLVLLVVIAAASLIQGVRTVVDQVVLATVTLFGLCCAAGLVISWLPWGLHPTWLASAAFTALIGVALATGRRPALAIRTLSTVDVVMLASMGGVAALVLRQFVKRDAIGRLALLAPGEDLARHFILYDAIDKLGGYAFLHPEAVADLTPADHANYPQGLHWMFAVLGRFWRSSDSPTSGTQAMDWLVWCHVMTFVVFAAAVLWAVRRMAGPSLGLAASLVILGSASAYLFFGDPLTIFLRVFPNELAGLGLAAVLLAILARPLTHPREQIVVIAATLVGLGFTYYLFLPVAAVAIVAWFIPRRKWVLSHVALVGGAAAFSLLAVIPAASNPKANQGAQFLLPGTAIPIDPAILLAALLIIAAGLIIGSGLRSAAWRTWTASAVAASLLAGGISVYQFIETGHKSSYYGEKAYHLVMIIAIVGLGAVTRLLPRLTVRGDEGRGARIRSGLCSGTLLLAVLTMFGAVNGPVSSSEGGSYGVGLVRGREGVVRDGPQVAYEASATYPEGAGRVTVDLSHGEWANFYGTLYGLSMQRTYVVGVEWYAFLYPDGPDHTLADLENRVLATAIPVRFVVSDSGEQFLTGNPAMTNADAARYLADKYPDRVEVVSLGA